VLADAVRECLGLRAGLDLLAGDAGRHVGRADDLLAGDGVADLAAAVEAGDDRSDAERDQHEAGGDAGVFEDGLHEVLLGGGVFPTRIAAAR
jgi:hypothetical protein